jgi:hypothetical protein
MHYTFSAAARQPSRLIETSSADYLSISAFSKIAMTHIVDSFRTLKNSKTTVGRSFLAFASHMSPHELKQIVVYFIIRHNHSSG